MCGREPLSNYYYAAAIVMKKDMTLFWKGIKKDNNTRIPLAPMVDNCIGDKEIGDMWQTHYKQLLNSVVTSSSKKIVQSELHSIADSIVSYFLSGRHF